MRRRASLAIATLIVATIAAGAAAPATLGDVPAAPYHGPAATTGTEFWFSFGANYSEPTTDYVDISGTSTTTATVAVPGLGFTTDVSVTPGQITSVALPGNATETATDGTESLGVHVTAAAPITVYTLEDLAYSTDGFTALPVTALGTDYYAMGYEAQPPESPEAEPSELQVIGTQDGTTVTITPSADSDDHPAGVPYTETLDAGQAYELIGEPGNDLTGTHITASAPVSVEAGAQCANIPSGSYYACNYVAEQMPPVDEWGAQFVTNPLATRTAGDTFRILAAENGTNVSIDGTQVGSLDAGQFYQAQLTSGSTIVTSEPALVAQYSDGTSFDNVAEADPSETLVPPTAQFLRNYTYTTPPDGRFTNYANLVVPNSATGAVQLDGAALPASDFTAVGQSGFSTAQIPVGIGTHNLSAPTPFGLIAYGFGSYDAYSYPGGFATGVLATSARRYVALGDSYSAGEGAYDTNGNAAFFPATATDEIKSNDPPDQCHRSMHAYPELVQRKIQAQSLTFAACSGATLPDLVAKVGSGRAGGQWDEGAQLNQIAPSGSADPSVNLVTLSISGNDFGFANDLGACVGGFGASFNSAGAGTEAACSREISAYKPLATELLTTGGSVNEDSNGDGSYGSLCEAGCNGKVWTPVPKFTDILGDIHDRAPNATIIVVGYPWLFPRNASKTCTVGFNGLAHYSISAANMQQVDAGVDYVDNLLKQLVASAGASGVTVRFADPRATFQGHDVCEPSYKSQDNPWRNQQYAWINPILFSSVGNTHPESFHPNAAGQSTYASLVAGCFENRSSCGSDPVEQIALGGAFASLPARWEPAGPSPASGNSSRAPGTSVSWTAIQPRASISRCSPFIVYSYTARHRSFSYRATDVMKSSRLTCSMAKRLIQAAYAEGRLKIIRTVIPPHGKALVSGPPVRWLQGGWRCTNGLGEAGCWNVQQPALNSIEATGSNSHSGAVSALVS